MSKPQKRALYITFNQLETLPIILMTSKEQTYEKVF